MKERIKRKRQRRRRRKALKLLLNEDALIAPVARVGIVRIHDLDGEGDAGGGQLFNRLGFVFKSFLSVEIVVQDTIKCRVIGEVSVSIRSESSR